MLVRTVAFVSMASAVSSRQAVIDTSSDIDARSKLGGRLLSKARQVDGKGRILDGDYDYSWVANYSIKFHSCVTTSDYYGGYFGGEDNENNDNGNDDQNQNQDRQNWNGMYEQRLVHFKLCPSSSCSKYSCENGADYVIDMNLFVDAYIESKATKEEYNCEMVAENCNCEDANDDSMCLYSCYQNAGIDYCEEAVEGAFQIEDYAYCTQMEVDEEAAEYYNYNDNGNNNNNNNNNYNGYYAEGGDNNNYNYNNNNNNGGEAEYFIGPTCSSNGKVINLAVFYEETCSYAAPSGVYEHLNYGVSLPYSSANIVEADCIPCQTPQDNNNQNDGDEVEILEYCTTLYEVAGKCETDLNIYTRNTMACNFIKDLNSSPLSFVQNQSLTAKIFAGMFAATTVAFGGIAYYYHAKAKRNTVNLSHRSFGGRQLA